MSALDYFAESGPPRPQEDTPSVPLSPDVAEQDDPEREQKIARAWAERDAVRSRLRQEKNPVSPPVHPVMPNAIFEAPPSPLLSPTPPSPVVLPVSRARAQRSSAPPPNLVNNQAPTASERARDGEVPGILQPAENRGAFREDDTARLSAEFKSAQQAIIDLKDQLKRRDDIIAQKDVALSETRHRLLNSRVAAPQSIQPVSRAEFDKIQVIKDLRHVIQLRDQKIAQCEAEALQAKNELAASLDTAGRPEVRDDHEQRQLLHMTQQQQYQIEELRSQLEAAHAEIVKHQSELGQMGLEFSRLEAHRWTRQEEGGGSAEVREMQEEMMMLRAQLHTSDSRWEEAEKHRKLLLEDLQALRKAASTQEHVEGHVAVRAASRSTPPLNSVSSPPGSPASMHALLAKVRDSEEQAAWLKGRLDEVSKELATTQKELLSVYDSNDELIKAQERMHSVMEIQEVLQLAHDRLTVEHKVLKSIKTSQDSRLESTMAELAATRADCESLRANQADPHGHAAASELSILRTRVTNAERAATQMQAELELAARQPLGDVIKDKNEEIARMQKAQEVGGE